VAYVDAVRRVLNKCGAGSSLRQSASSATNTPGHRHGCEAKLTLFSRFLALVDRKRIGQRVDAEV
jgi:hypothetical protein